MDKVSEMLIAVSGELLQSAESLHEMQAHLDLVKHAWNLSLLSEQARTKELKRFIKKQKKYAPSAEALKGLEWEYKRIMKQKNRLYPEVGSKIEWAEAVETSKDNYIIRAYFYELNNN